MEIRNIAIIAHVDHGKTKITDALLRQTGMIQDDSQSMDSNALELERGITIYAKNTALIYKDTKINIIDTPGHADFGSEVERVFRSIDSVLLVVDAQEGPMPQTRFVLRKSLELGLKPLVVINKIDKPAARPTEVIDEVLELFMDLGATDEQLDFEVIYTNAKAGLAKLSLEDESDNMNPLLDKIIEAVSPAKSDTDKSLQMQVFNLGYDDYLGRLGIARIYEGTLKNKSKVFVKNENKDTQSGQISKIFTFKGFDKEEVDEAVAGDIVMIAGLPDIYIGDTITDSEDIEPLPSIKVDEPTMSLGIMVNNSPFSGQDGSLLTSSQIKERLEKELEMNVGLKIDFTTKDQYTVRGRGELHLAVLLENMRREGFELQVSQPKVILKKDGDQTLEPFEELNIDVPDTMAGNIIERIAKRKGTMTNMESSDGRTRITFDIPTRGLIGYRSEFIVETKGEGIITSCVSGFKPHVGDIHSHNTGSMVSMATGKALGYSLDNLQSRGKLYIKPTTEVYEGMVIGNVSKGDDLRVNPIKGKQLTNMRSSGADDALSLDPPEEVTLERGLEIMREDELLEITPKNVRLRKKELK